ncbi:ABC transporter ATP-binding protein [Granulicatella adiacens]
MVNKMSVIELQQIKKSYADGNQMRDVICDLNLTVEPQEFVAILGPSGSGKSTLLSIAGLLLSSDSGQVIIGGQNLTNLKQSEWTKKRLELLGFIFQDHQLLPYMKIGDQLEVVAKLKGEKDASKRKEEVKGLLAELGIENCYGQYPNQMSGGQKQRAAIARAFIGNPQLILADEPTASLDPERGKEIAQLIQREVKSKHKSAIMVTHDRSVLEYVDTVYEMKKGKLVRLKAFML